MQKRFLSALLISLGIISIGYTADQTQPNNSAPAILIQEIQRGGHILYVRHGVTDHSQKDEFPPQLDDCSTQRNLSDVGREKLKKISAMIQQLEIPIGNVFSSPYCGCKETAQLVFGKYTIEPDLQFSISKNKEESIHLGEKLRAMMMAMKPGSKNDVFVGHTSNLKDGLGVWPKPEAVIVVFQKTKDKIMLKGMIEPDAWENLE